ncbi:Homeobox-leucine zipper protein HOX20 [Hibiscus syriacus]|uniref:Homeobox-leucine zipper protein n=1 Tax=Hibiscus syriacus TaxID=106335 RepID=A0A6A2ZGF8_HIBSY|nr:homeobox-leucine zipper protein ATHB-54-like [Hibiscus syriacus]KAE8690793.1 Homeobox-leucine zipper protein HOX20 [Hibiscus syriacus]
MNMEGGKICGGLNMNALVQSEQLSCSSQVMESLWIPSSSSALQGQQPVISYEDADGMETGFFEPVDKEDNGDDDFDGSYQPAEKKRRLTATQVGFLERSFEIENKLEPDRKLQLATELGLQPRQVAIWFQNRGARLKNKQLEKDYDSMKASYEKLKADYDNLLKEKDGLRNEVLELKEKLLIREKGCENLESLDAMNSSKTPLGHVSHVSLLACKQEEACSAKSDVFDSDHHSSLIEPENSSNVLEPDPSDISQDDEDNLSKSFLHMHPPLFFPKFELDCYYDAHGDSCNFELPVEDQSFWSSPLMLFAHEDNL